MNKYLKARELVRKWWIQDYSKQSLTYITKYSFGLVGLRYSVDTSTFGVVRARCRWKYISCKISWLNCSIWSWWHGAMQCYKNWTFIALRGYFWGVTPKKSSKVKNHLFGCCLLKAMNVLTTMWQRQHYLWCRWGFWQRIKLNLTSDHARMDGPGTDQ